MVAKVRSGKNIRGILNYNENKVKEHKAICIMASGFAMEHTALTFTQKLVRFQKLLAQNTKVKTNALHISLNFDPSEKFIPATLCQIASTYMHGIGFENQPYLVYQHQDAAHPHIHIVTTNIAAGGKRIDIHDIGRKKSEPTRKAIEAQFNLVQAQSKPRSRIPFMPVAPQAATYGKTETKRAIANIVRYVTTQYKYTSMPELNAALRQFNIMANAGSEGSALQHHRGLIYTILDQTGKPVGVPIKASAIYGKPTRAYLDKQVELNKTLRKPHLDKLRKTIDFTSNGYTCVDLQTFIQRMHAKGVFVLLRQNETKRIYGITYVDNRTRTVFNGSDLGKRYSVKALLEKLKTNANRQSQHTSEETSTSTHYENLQQNPWEILNNPHHHDYTVQAPFKKRKRKRKH
jgi:hypothetical protein